MDRLDFIGFSLDENNQPTLNTIGGGVREDIFLDWYVNQDYVFERVAEEVFHLLTAQEFIKRYDEHIKTTVKERLSFHEERLSSHEEKLKLLINEIEMYDRYNIRR